MASASKIYDVFVSHAAADATLASEVANACRASGLEAATAAELLPVENASDAVWDALAESRALLAILPPSGPTPAMAIEIGAARAWNKPIYALVTDPTSIRVPAELAGIPRFTTGRIQDVIHSIRSSAQQLSDDDRAFLVQVYSDLGASVDDLALHPKRLGDLTRRFNNARRKAIGGERLLSELLRLRKQGRLWRTGRAIRSSSPGGAP